MTLNLLNTQHVKLMRETCVMGAGLLLAIVSLLSVTPWHRARAAGVDELKLTASDGAAFDNFGYSIATSGSTLVVGVPSDLGGNLRSGSVYVFNHHGGGWVETQKLTASDGAVGDFFGFSVAFSGSKIVVGAPGDTIGASNFQGSAYVFSLSGGSWVETQKLTGSDGKAGDLFGRAVAIDGSNIVVATQTNGLGARLEQGLVYVFNRLGESWVETQKLNASDGVQGDNFGWSVAVSGSTIVVGAIDATIGGNRFQGSAYVYNRQGASWVETQKLTASEGGVEDHFGWSVTVSGSTIVVGAPLDSIGGVSDRGSAYVYNRRGTSWVETQKLTASDGSAGDFFGWSVAFTSSTIAVGAPNDKIGNDFPGSAYVFGQSGGSWLETQKLTASDGGASDFFGRSVALSGSIIFVGASAVDVGGNFNQGAVTVFEK